MTALSEISSLIQKEFQIEKGSRNMTMSTVLYVFSTIFICYLAFGPGQDINGGLVWLIILFAIINSSNKVFYHESGSQRIYLYTLAKARNIIIAKLIYQWLSNGLLSQLILLIWAILFGMDSNLALKFLIILLPGVCAISNILTLNSALASGTKNGPAVLAVLSLPVVIPILMTVVRATGQLMSSPESTIPSTMIVVLALLNVLTASLSIILFEYLWRY